MAPTGWKRNELQLNLKPKRLQDLAVKLHRGESRNEITALIKLIEARVLPDKRMWWRIAIDQRNAGTAVIGSPRAILLKTTTELTDRQQRHPGTQPHHL